MPRLVLTAFDTGEPVVVDIPDEAELLITSGAEGSTSMTIRLGSLERIVVVQEPPTYIYLLRDSIAGSA